MKARTKSGFSLILILIAVGGIAVALVLFYFAFGKSKAGTTSIIPGKTPQASQQLSKTDKISDIDADLDATSFNDIDASLQELETAF